MTGYWDPLPSIPELEGTRSSGEPYPLRAPSTFLNGQWSERNWRNLPGPLYGAATDSCWTGRLAAPCHVLYDDEHGSEFLFRQPADLYELRQVIAAAALDPFEGYAADGDSHWTPAMVADWWSGRARLIEWAVRLIPQWSTGNSEQVEAVRGLRQLLTAFGDGSAGEYLRGYLFWLTERRTPTPADRLPDLPA